MDPKNYVQGARSKIVESKGGGTLVNIHLCKISKSKEKKTHEVIPIYENIIMLIYFVITSMKM